MGEGQTEEISQVTETLNQLEIDYKPSTWASRKKKIKQTTRNTASDNKLERLREEAENKRTYKEEENLKIIKTLLKEEY